MDFLKDINQFKNLYLKTDGFHETHLTKPCPQTKILITLYIPKIQIHDLDSPPQTAMGICTNGPFNPLVPKLQSDFSGKWEKMKDA